jgi:ribosome-binding protein aMBF1 (putative translation factor)
MITNERQYRITKAEAARFEQALAQADEQNKHLHPALRKAAREGLESQLQELQEQLEAYEALCAGTETSFVLDSLTNLPEVLIKARIARGLTQKQLADALNLSEQQVQRYEATLYKGAALDRIEAVAKALGLRETVRFELSMPPPVAGAQA